MHVTCLICSIIHILSCYGSCIIRKIYTNKSNKLYDLLQGVNLFTDRFSIYKKEEEGVLGTINTGLQDTNVIGAKD